MIRQNTSLTLLSLAALLAPSALHAQAVGGFVSRPGVPTALPPTVPVYNGASVYNNGSSIYNNPLSPTYNTTPVYRTAPSAPVVTQSAPSRVFTNQVYSNAPVYQSTSGFRNGPAFQNTPVYQNTPYGGAPVYHNSPIHRSGPSYEPTSGNPVATLYNFPAATTHVYRITTPHGTHNSPNGPGYNNYPIYNNVPNYGYYGPSTTILLGGYYYGNYCDVYAPGAFPSVYGYYTGFPTYVIGPGVSVTTPAYPVYVTSYLPFDAPAYPVNYNENYYYVTSPARVQEIADGGQEAQQAVKDAVPAGSFQAAFGDIEQAWQTGNIGLLRKHIRDEDTKISVFLKNKYAYSLASGDLIQITRDAFDRLDTVSFQFDHLRKAKNGDVTAYGQHVYRSRDDADGATPDGDVVPFTTDGGAGSDTGSASPAAQDKTVYVSYTLRHGNGLWYIVGVNSSPTPVIKQ